MPTHLQVLPCPQKQIVRKYVRDVPCPRVKPKKKGGVPCPGEKSKKIAKQIEEAVCSSPKRVQPVTCPPKQPVTCPSKQPVTCPSKQPVTCPSKQPSNCAPQTCPGKERKISAQGCPKCESNRIQKLECEVYQLRKEIENMKYERREAEKAIQKAILRSAQALGGRFKPMIPGSIEKLLDTCNSDTSSQSTTSLTICAAKTMSPAIHACHNNKVTKKKEFDYCEGCNH